MTADTSTAPLSSSVREARTRSGCPAQLSQREEGKFPRRTAEREPGASRTHTAVRLSFGWKITRNKTKINSEGRRKRADRSGGKGPAHRTGLPARGGEGAARGGGCRAPSWGRRGPGGRGPAAHYLLCQPCRRLVYLLSVPSSTGSRRLPMPPGACAPPGLAAAEPGLPPPPPPPPPPSSLPAAAARPGSPRPAEEDEGEEPADAGRLLLRLLLLLPPPSLAAAFSMEPRGTGCEPAPAAAAATARQSPDSRAAPREREGRRPGEKGPGRGGRGSRAPPLAGGRGASGGRWGPALGARGARAERSRGRRPCGAVRVSLRRCTVHARGARPWRYESCARGKQRSAGGRFSVRMDARECPRPRSVAPKRRPSVSRSRGARRDACAQQRQCQSRPQHAAGRRSVTESLRSEKPSQIT